MNYDRYVERIYEWLIDNEIAGKLSDLVANTDRLIELLIMVLQFGFFAFLVGLGLHFIKKRWLTLV